MLPGEQNKNEPAAPNCGASVCFAKPKSETIKYHLKQLIFDFFFPILPIKNNLLSRSRIIKLFGLISLCITLFACINSSISTLKKTKIRIKIIFLKTI